MNVREWNVLLQEGYAHLEVLCHLLPVQTASMVMHSRSCKSKALG